jgi:hypothetical protein
MKAEDYLNSKKIWEGTYVIDQSAPENYFNLKDLIETYARIQIEKDRKRILQEYYNGTNTSDFNTMVKNIPIILD